MLKRCPSLPHTHLRRRDLHRRLRFVCQQSHNRAHGKASMWEEEEKKQKKMKASKKASFTHKARLSKGTAVVKGYLQTTTIMAISGSRGNSEEATGARANQAVTQHGRCHMNG